MKGSLIGKAYWSGLALVLLAEVFLAGCSSTPQTPPPTQLLNVAATGGVQQSANLNKAYGTPFAVTVTNNGTPVSGATVTFTAPASGAGGTFANGSYAATATMPTNAMGVATSTAFTADGTVGTYNVVASTPGTRSTATFFLSNTTVPASIAATKGTPQSISVTKNSGTDLDATVLDGSGNPVAGIEVTFSAPTVGASGLFGWSGNTPSITILTNSSGVAAITSGNFTANSVQGSYTITASVPGVAGTASFSLTNTP